MPQKLITLSLRNKIALMMAAVMAFLLIILALVVLSLFSSGMRDGTDTLLKDDMSTIRSLLTLNKDGSLELFTLKPPDDDETTRDIRYQVRSLKGEILLASGNLSTIRLPVNIDYGNSNAHNFRDIEIDGELIRNNSTVYTLHNSNFKETVVIHTLRSIDPFRQHEERLKRILLWILPLPIIFIIIGSWMVSTRALRPINQMVDTVQTMGADDLQQLLPVVQDDEVGRLAKTFNLLFQRLDRSFQSLRRFTADASHELRGPLATIRAQSEVALSHQRNPAEYRQILGNVLEEVQHLEQLTDLLLNLARSDAGIIKMEKCVVDLSQLLRNWVERFSIVADEKRIRIRTAIDADVSLLADTAILERALANLIDNAIKFSEENGEININLVKQNGLAILSVADSGPGIPEAEHDKVFERFVRIDSARGRTDGFGLGLSLAKWAVEAHDGHITVRNLEPRGCCFTITLPLS